MKKVLLYILLILMFAVPGFAADGDLIVEPGSTGITTVGTLTVGEWNADEIQDAYIADDISTIDYQTITGDAGSTTATATEDSLAIVGTENISTAVTADTVTISGTLLAPKAGPTFTGTVTVPSTDLTIGATTFSETQLGDLLAGTVANIPSDESLAGYWAFDDGSRSVAVDGSGHGNDGTLVNMEDADWVDGVVGKCLDFDGVDESVSVADDASLNLTDFSISLRVYNRAGDKDYPTLFNRHIQSTDGYYWVLTQGVDEADVYFNWNNGSANDNVIWTGALEKDTWNHLVFVLDNTADTIILYVDGVSQGVKSVTNIVVPTSGDFYIGTYNGDGVGTEYPFNGLIDEVRIYSTALTASEIKALYLYPAGNKGSKISARQVDGTGLSVYANNAAAVVGGLAVGDFYRTNGDPDPVCVVH